MRFRPPADLRLDTPLAGHGSGIPQPPPEASRDGVTLHVERSGPPCEPGRPVFVLLHGFGASTFTWRRWLPELQARGHVARVDLLGFGASPKPTEARYGPEAQSEYVLRALRRLGPGPRVLVGHSLGGGVALLAALALQDAGEAPSHLVIVAGAAYPQRLPPFVRIARTPRLAAFLMRAIGARSVVRQVLRSIVFDPAVLGDDIVEGYAGPLETPDAIEALISAAREIRPAHLDRIVVGYPRLRVPTLLLWGRYDRVVPPWVGERLAHELPDARMRIVERCGHMPQDERPRASWSEVASFLDS